MKQVKIIESANLGMLAGNINSEIRHLIESGRTNDILDIKLTPANDAIIGMIIYDDKGSYIHTD